MNLRKELGYKNIHLGSGRNRSRIAKQSYRRGREAESRMEQRLVQLFGRPFVHVERPLRDKSSKSRMDFYVFAPQGNFGIDVFTCSSRHSLITHVNIKLPRYDTFHEELFLVPIGEAMTQQTIGSFIVGRRTVLPKNVKVLTEHALWQEVGGRSAYVCAKQKGDV